MYWILATIFIVVALAVPRLRPIGVIGCVLLGAMLIWGVIERLRAPNDDGEPSEHQRGRPSSPATMALSIAPARVLIENVQMKGGGAPFELQGRIVNESEALLKSVTLLVTRRDCYEGALDPTGCAVLWQDRQWISIVIPPGESREFSSSVWMHGAALRVRGTVEDSFEVVAASGELAPVSDEANDAR